MRTNEELQTILKRWRDEHPESRGQADTEVIDAIMVELAKTQPDRVSVRRGEDGKNIFRITNPYQPSQNSGVT